MGVGVNIERKFLFKELGFELFHSYGPRRYDPLFEERGIDYLIGYVRWIEQRNMEAILDIISQKKINIKELITHRIPIEFAPDA